MGYVQRAVGYSLTGLVTEQVWWLLHGIGANGKSTLLNVLKHVFGSYARTIPFNSILLPERPIPDDIAVLVERRLVYASEAIEGRRLNEARIKVLTGGDAFAARHLYGQWFEFQPVLKLWLGCNHLPTVQDTSHGFWRRVHVLPFERKFKKDKTLQAALIAEGPGILRWIVQGARAWLRDGLQPPDRVLLATEHYQQASDQLGEFLADRCDTGSGLSVGATDLHLAYGHWATDRGIPQADRLTMTAFGTRMAERFTKAHTQLGNIYRGVGLRNAP